MEEFIMKYKIGLSVFFGTMFIAIATYAPAIKLLLLTEQEIKWGADNWIFMGLGIVFLWGRIVTLAKIITGVFAKSKGVDLDDKDDKQ